jgi:peptide/nickel transport system permease protein
MPSFAVGLALLVVFSFSLRLFPVSGNQGPESLVLPSLAMALPIAAVLAQVLRGSLEDVLEQPFILTARTRGMRDAGVRLRHGLRHALIPLVTLTGFVVGGLLGGAVITETLFVRQGVGRLLINAVQAKDVPVVVGVVLLAALIHVVVNLIVDVVYSVIDPRIVTS